jgi:hypothetical protein
MCEETCSCSSGAIVGSTIWADHPRTPSIAGRGAQHILHLGSVAVGEHDDRGAPSRSGGLCEVAGQ